MGIRGELYSSKVLLRSRSYFFNIKENRNGDLYFNIVESKSREGSGFERQSVIVFEEDLQEFLKGFDESLKVFEKTARDKRRQGSSFGKRSDYNGGADAYAGHSGSDGYTRRNGQDGHAGHGNSDTDGGGYRDYGFSKRGEHDEEARAFPSDADDSSLKTENAEMPPTRPEKRGFFSLRKRN
jgi:hypothetical protein